MKEEASLDCPQAAFSTAWCTIPDTTVYQNKGEKRGKSWGEKVWEGEEEHVLFFSTYFTCSAACDEQ